MHAHAQGNHRSAEPAAARAAGLSSSAQAQRMLVLQRLAGNAAVARAVEADRHEHGPGCGHAGGQDAGPVDSRRLLETAMAGPSRPLAGSLLGEAESFYENDLSATRLHDDPTAQRATAALGAQAMTVGTHVFLGTAAQGRKDIIGHELGHVDKNLRGNRETGHNNGSGIAVTDPGQASERTAEADGAAFAAGAERAPSVVAQRRVAQGAHDTVPAVQRSVAGSGGALTAGSNPVIQRYDDRRSGRRRRVSVNSLSTYIHRPHYVSRGKREGGAESTATLGPNSHNPRGSDADPSLPSAIREAREEYDIDFKAGHLLNADFGGSGSDYANLTILTPGANRRHQNFDNPVKMAVDHLRRVYELMADQYLPIDELDYGIDVSVTVSRDKWSRRGTGQYITERLYCSAAADREADVYDMLLRAHDDDDGHSHRPIYNMMERVNAYIGLANRASVIENE